MRGGHLEVGLRHSARPRGLTRPRHSAAAGARQATFLWLAMLFLLVDESEFVISWLGMQPTQSFSFLGAVYHPASSCPLSIPCFHEEAPRCAAFSHRFAGALRPPVRPRGWRAAVSGLDSIVDPIVGHRELRQASAPLSQDAAQCPRPQDLPGRRAPGPHPPE